VTTGQRDGGYADPDAPLAARVADLLGQLTLAEKVSLLHQYQAPVPRLGLGGFKTGTEALHGLAWLGPATVFPQAVGLAAMWHPALVREVGAAVGDEVRGFHHKDPDRAGLNVWAPVVNLLRDPRWGRNEEGYAEDPWLTGVVATAYARGLRGDHPTYLRTAPTLKHFLAYNNETDRHLTSSNVPPRVLREYELPAFRAPIAAGAAVAVMASYNLVNGRPAHLSPLINGELRRWTDADVLVVGDAAAVSNIAGEQGWYADHAEGYAAALRAGVDSYTEDDGDPAPTVALVTEALRRGLLTEADVDTAVGHALSIRFRLGEFDPPERNPYAAITADVINCSAHQRLAHRAARASIVLLRTDRRLLPLSAAGKPRVAVLGPLADTVLEDWYSGTLPYAVTAYAGITARLGTAVHVDGVDRVALRCPSTGRYVVADEDPGGGPLRLAGDDVPPPDAWFDVFDWGRDVVALRAAANGRHVGAAEDGTLVNDRPVPHGWVIGETFRFTPRPGGVALHHLATGRFVATGPDGRLRADAASAAEATVFRPEVVVDGTREAAAAARAADVAIVVLGNHPMINGRETEDRVDLALPAAQERLLRAVSAANPRTVLVLCSGYPYAFDAGDLPAVLWSAHGGQEYGHALADVLFGEDAEGHPVDPAGRLPQTWYADQAELPDLLDYDVIGADATYLYYRGEPMHPFGHGLSYTEFEYADLRLSAADVPADGRVTVAVDVTNAGDRTGEEVVQLYTRQRRSRVKQPLRQLRGFARVRLAPGERKTVRFELAAADLAFWDVTRGRAVVETAKHTVAVGRSCGDLRLTATLAVHGEEIPPRDPAGPLRAVDADEYAGTEPVAVAGSEGVRSSYAGAWLAFLGVDLGRGLTGVRVDGVPAGGPVTVRLDDPLAGPPAATAGAGGVRDLFLVFETAGTTVSTVELDVTAGAGE
jgi:beta-glucosidase